MWVTKQAAVSNTFRHSAPSIYTKWIGNSAVLEHTKNKLSVIANSDLSVLISGAEGSDKIIAARSLHDTIQHGDFTEIHCEQWQPPLSALHL